MIPSLKFLGLGVALTLAVSAVGASVASAGVFHFSAESTNLTGEALGAQSFKMTVGEEREISCGKISVASGLVLGKTAEKVTFKPKYEECTYKISGSSGPATIDFTECAYELTSGTNESEHAKLRIECPNEGEHIHVKVTSMNFGCFDIPPQEVTGLRYENMGETTESEQRSLDVHATTAGLVTTTKGLCKAAGESEVHNNGSIGGVFRLKGDNTINEPVDIFYG